MDALSARTPSSTQDLDAASVMDDESGGVAGEAPPDASVAALARAVGLRIVSRSSLRLTRRKAGRGFCYLDAKGRPIRDAETRKRLAALAVPPAYGEVRYAADTRAHLQAVGLDAAGRLQYRYHPRWEEVRERRKAQRLACFAEAMSRIRRAIARDLAAPSGSRDLAVSAVVELVAFTAIRAGGETYARAHGTRGAATLLKSNLRCEGERLILSFRAKGGRRTVCEIADARFCRVIAALRDLPGRRLFQYRDAEGNVRPVRAGDVNAYLRKVARLPVSLKDFRTLVASTGALDALAREVPAPSARRRKAQVVAAIRAAADLLQNTPAVCRRSYVLPAIVTAFEDGSLARFSDALRRARSVERRALILAALLRDGAVRAPH